jgi:hypothetical protein
MTGLMEHEREHNRELEELLSELRVILPGVTVLFAFLLTVPFAAGFGRLAPEERVAYFVAFLATAFAIVLLLGESAYHRIRGHPYDKGRLLRTATHQAGLALGLLSVALTAVVFLVTGVLYDRGASVLAAGAVFASAMGTWFLLPLIRRLRGE